MRKSNKLIYSTESGSIKEGESRHKTTGPAGKVIKMRREVKGRGGKTVTTLDGFNLPENELHQLASEIKRYCGCGGSVKNGVIIIQGDQRQKIEDYLRVKGYKLKRAGG